MGVALWVDRRNFSVRPPLPCILSPRLWRSWRRCLPLLKVTRERPASRQGRTMALCEKVYVYECVETSLQNLVEGGAGVGTLNG